MFNLGSIKEKLPLIFTITSIIGLTITTVVSHENGVKLKERLEEIDETTTRAEAVKKLAPVLISSAVPYAATAFSIGAAYATGNNLYRGAIEVALATKVAFDEYRNKNIELFGEENDHEIYSSIIDDHADAHIAYNPDEEILFHEPIMDTYFWGNGYTCADIERTINKAVFFDGVCSMKEIYDTISFKDKVHGISRSLIPKEELIQYGWNAEDMFSGYMQGEWVYLATSKKSDKEHGDYHELVYAFYPWEDYFDVLNRGCSIEEYYEL